MRYCCTTLVILLIASAAKADECNIIWWDLFLPSVEVEFEKTSDVSAILTLKDTIKHDPIRFELAAETLTGEDGAELDLLLGKQTLVAEGLSNQVTVTLQPKSSSWIIGFDSEQTLRTKSGRAYSGKTNVAGYLVCDQLKPWSWRS